LRSIKQPLDIYAAIWLPAGELKKYGRVPNGDGGYFTFIAGGFRWLSGIESFKASEQNGTDAKVIEQRLVNNVLIYPPEAAAQHIVATVRFCWRRSEKLRRMPFTIGGISPKRLRACPCQQKLLLTSPSPETIRGVDVVNSR
jgi:hypothetical protein